MNPQDFLSRGLKWLLGALALGAVGAMVLRRLRQRRERGHWHQHVQRLSSEIVEVAESIQIDLQALPRTSDVADLARRCNDCRKRAEDAGGGPLDSTEALQDAIGLLHEDHRRVVDLRSELDALIAARRSGKPAPRSCKFATGSKPSRSRWSSTSLLTRPSTLG